MSAGSMEVGECQFFLHFMHAAFVLCRDLPTFVLEKLLSLVGWLVVLGLTAL